MAKFFLANPGFELGDQDWTKNAGWDIVNDAVNSRTGSWVGEYQAEGGQLTSGYFSMRPGGKISYSAWFKQTADRDIEPVIDVEWYDKDQVAVTNSSNATVTAGTTAYTQASLSDRTAPAKTKYVRVRVFTGIGTLGTVWVDDVDASGDVIEAIPSAAIISRYRIIPADTIAVFDPLIGDDKFSEFNSGMSDKWAGVYTFVPQQIGSGDLQELISFLVRIGKTDRFFAYDPGRKTPLNGIVSGMTVDGAVTAGTNKIPVTGGPTSSTALVAGDYVEVGAQYFQLQRDLVIGPEDTGDMIVWPAVRASLADGEDVITDNPKMVARITSDLEWARAGGALSEISVSWQEV